MLIRVVAQHAPALFAILGLTDDAELAPTYQLTDTDGELVTYYRALTKPNFYVLYKRAIQGEVVGFDFNKAQK